MDHRTTEETDVEQSAAYARPESDPDVAEGVAGGDTDPDEHGSVSGTPIDELVETAGLALGDSSSWAEQPLATFEGEAGAWDAVAAHGGSAEAGPSDAEDDGAAEAAQALEAIARRLRDHGWDALASSADDRLTSALAAFIAGYRAGRDG